MEDREDSEEMREDMEALMPRRAAVLGLKVADEAEADQVQKVTTAVLCLAGVLVLHFFVHLAHSGHIMHGLFHLCTSFLLPLLGYYAVSNRSSKGIWAFHLGTAFTALLHGILLIFVLVHIGDLGGKDPGVECSSLIAPAHKCPQSAEMTVLNSLSADGRFWRCGGGLCIASAGRCNGETNCYDHSDEEMCPQGADFTAARPPAMVDANRQAEEEARIRCEEKMAEEKLQSPRLKWWWIFMTAPLWGLCSYAAYQSLEFYVQLRVKKFDVRIGSHGFEATVFERPEE